MILFVNRVERIGKPVDTVRLWRNLAAWFSRDAFGNATNVDPSGSLQNYAYGINHKSEVKGYWADSHQLYHGFLGEPSGSLTSFSVPVKTTERLFSISTNARQMTGFSCSKITDST